MLPAAALGSLAARFCWQGQHFRLGRYPSAFRGPPPSCCQAQHLAASRLVSAGRGSTSGSGRYPSAFRGLVLMLPRSTWEPRGSFLLAGAALQALDSTRARFGAPPPLMLPGAALGLAPPCQAQHLGASRLVSAGRGALDGARARFGAPPLMLPGAALGSLAA